MQELIIKEEPSRWLADTPCVRTEFMSLNRKVVDFEPCISLHRERETRQGCKMLQKVWTRVLPPPGLLTDLLGPGTKRFHLSPFP